MPIARPLDSRTWLGLGLGLGLDSRTWSGQRRLGGPCGAAKMPRVVSAVRGACAPRLCPGLFVSLSVCLYVCLSVTSAALEAASSSTRGSGWAPGGLASPLGAPSQSELSGASRGGAGTELRHCQGASMTMLSHEKVDKVASVIL